MDDQVFTCSRCNSQFEDLRPTVIDKRYVGPHVCPTCKQAETEGYTTEEEEAKREPSSRKSQHHPRGRTPAFGTTHGTLYYLLFKKAVIGKLNQAATKNPQRKASHHPAKRITRKDRKPDQTLARKKTQTRTSWISH